MDGFIGNLFGDEFGIELKKKDTKELVKKSTPNTSVDTDTEKILKSKKLGTLFANYMM